MTDSFFLNASSIVSNFYLDDIFNSGRPHFDLSTGFERFGRVPDQVDQSLFEFDWTDRRVKRFVGHRRLKLTVRFNPIGAREFHRARDERGTVARRRECLR